MMAEINAVWYVFVFELLVVTPLSLSHKPG